MVLHTGERPHRQYLVALVVCLKVQKKHNKGAVRRVIDMPGNTRVFGTTVQQPPPSPTTTRSCQSLYVTSPSFACITSCCRNSPYFVLLLTGCEHTSKLATGSVDNSPTVLPRRVHTQTRTHMTYCLPQSLCTCNGRCALPILQTSWGGGLENSRHSLLTYGFPSAAKARPVPYNSVSVCRSTHTSSGLSSPRHTMSIGCHGSTGTQHTSTSPHTPPSSITR